MAKKFIPKRRIAVIKAKTGLKSEVYQHEVCENGKSTFTKALSTPRLAAPIQK